MHKNDYASIMGLRLGRWGYRLFITTMVLITIVELATLFVLLFT